MNNQYSTLYNNFNDYYKELLYSFSKSNNKDFVPSRNGNIIEKHFSNFTLDLSDDVIPITDARFIYYSIAREELNWMLQGSENFNYLLDKGITIWKKWSNEKNDSKYMYGYNWRNFNGFDQLNSVIDSLYNRDKRTMRKLVISSWRPDKQPILESCITQLQFMPNYKKNTLSLHVYQRSCDIAIGLPYDVVVYSLLLKTIAELTNLKIKYLHYTLGNYHLYEEHCNVLYDLYKNCSSKTYYFKNFEWELKSNTLQVTKSNVKDYHAKKIKLKVIP